MISEAFVWPHRDFAYLRVNKCASSALTNQFHDVDGYSKKHPPAEIGASLRLMVVRNPVDRAVSYWAGQQHRQSDFGSYLERLPGLIYQGDPHVAPYADDTEHATELVALERLTDWWPRLAGRIPEMFDTPLRSIGQSRIGKPELTRQQSAYLEEIYREDLIVWRAL